LGHITTQGRRNNRPCPEDGDAHIPQPKKKRLPPSKKGGIQRVKRGACKQSIAQRGDFGGGLASVDSWKRSTRFVCLSNLCMRGQGFSMASQRKGEIIEFSWKMKRKNLRHNSQKIEHLLEYQGGNTAENWGGGGGR